VWGWERSPGGLRGVLTEEQMLVIFSRGSHMYKNAGLGERGDKIKIQE